MFQYLADFIHGANSFQFLLLVGLGHIPKGGFLFDVIFYWKSGLFSTICGVFEGYFNTWFSWKIGKMAHAINLLKSQHCHILFLNILFFWKVSDFFSKASSK